MSQLRVVDDPAWRVARARAGGLASAEKRARARDTQIAAYPDKWAAYEAGYRAAMKAVSTRLAALKARDEA